MLLKWDLNLILHRLVQEGKERTCGETAAKHKGENQHFNFWCNSSWEFLWLCGGPRYILYSLSQSPFSSLCWSLLGNKLLFLALEPLLSKSEVHSLKLCSPFSLSGGSQWILLISPFPQSTPAPMPQTHLQWHLHQAGSFSNLPVFSKGGMEVDKVKQTQKTAKAVKKISLSSAKNSNYSWEL